MAYSYNEILERMQDKYYEISGYRADDCGDIVIRLRVLAGEIFSMGSQIDWLKRQMFYSTASGKQLELHAAARGLSRLKGKKASGIVVIRTDVPSEYEISIPAGTVFTNKDGSLHYISTEDCVIHQGTMIVYTEVEAEETGTVYNQPSRSICAVLTYLSEGITVDNSSSITGGTDDEDDDSLRRRIEQSYREISDGANAFYYRKLAESIDGIQSASVREQTGQQNTIYVYVAGRGELCTGDMINAAQALIDSKRCAGTIVQVNGALLTTVNVSVDISAKDGYRLSDVKSAVEESIRNYFLSLNIGQTVFVAEIGRAVINTPGVLNYSFNNLTDVTNADNRLSVAGTITVGEL